MAATETAEADTLIDSPGSQLQETESQEQIVKEFNSKFFGTDCHFDCVTVLDSQEEAEAHRADGKHLDLGCSNANLEATQWPDAKQSELEQPATLMLPKLKSVKSDEETRDLSTPRQRLQRDMARPGAPKSPSKKQRRGPMGRHNISQGPGRARKKQRCQPVPTNEEMDALFSQARPDSSETDGPRSHNVTELANVQCNGTPHTSPSVTAENDTRQDRVHDRNRHRMELREILRSHEFIPYTEYEIQELCSIIKSLMRRDLYPRFPGLTWLFVRHKPLEVDTCIDWCLTTTDFSIIAQALVDHWCSPYANGHDSAGVFGNSRGKNCLIALGATLKRDMQEMMTDEVVLTAMPRECENRTGFTSAVYTARHSDALILKVSEPKDEEGNCDIKLFHESAIGGESVNLQELAMRLSQHLGLHKIRS
eukprot:gnl/MRDRNA2_/MRDRNA2_65512_c0_seq3.p1 gnl/MRDRNA2_/MRDRNA2_65512_c0~~gnl/MRDRNA2_/MRDRNA2_65512_c0_seq3.p1  ORF type:complete len:423 (+),score=66.06 gnl/MRDRNA2_/MRDRNA2_65512_c0_seq3:90-1358(+)